MTMASDKTYIRSDRWQLMFLVLLASFVNGIVVDAESKEKYLGSDGFSDCNILCNPTNGYPFSCNLYCKDYLSKKSEHNENSSNKFPWSIVLAVACPVIVLTIATASIYRYRTAIKTKIGTNIRLPFSIEKPNKNPLSDEESTKIPFSKEESGEQDKPTDAMLALGRIVDDDASAAVGSSSPLD